ncbi:MAG: DinB family protein, partial [Actinomycetota bacterium]|nr:DinB family protein [Actinomycetota bacterium]
MAAEEFFTAEWRQGRCWSQRQWINFILDGPSAMGDGQRWTSGDRSQGFRMLQDETLSGLLDKYEQVARRS